MQHDTVQITMFSRAGFILCASRTQGKEEGEGPHVD